MSDDRCPICGNKLKKEGEVYYCGVCENIFVGDLEKRFQEACPICLSKDISKSKDGIKCNNCGSVLNKPIYISDIKDMDDNLFQDILSLYFSSPSEINNEEEYDSGLNIQNEITIVLPKELVDICEDIQTIVGENEFSILVKEGEWKDGKFYLKPEFVIPKQKVTKYSVRFDESLAKYQKGGLYNIIIHSHPFTTNAEFSGQDWDTINANFEISLLYCKGGFTDGNYRLKVNEDLFINIPVKVEVDRQIQKNFQKLVNEVIRNEDNSWREDILHRNGKRRVSDRLHKWEILQHRF